MVKLKKAAKAKKPHPYHPLFPHQAGYWAKKVRGKLRYFGKVVDDPKGDAALEKWIEQRDDLIAGRVPRVKANGLTVRELCNRFLSVKKDLLDSGELAPRSFAELHATCKRIGDSFGWGRLVVDLVADDFDRLRRSCAKLWGPHRLAGEVGRTRSLFKFGHDAGLIEQPVRYGPTFKKPSRKVLRLHRAQASPKMIEAPELRKVVEAASTPLRAMILLGINSGFGNTDVATLPRRALDLKNGWVDFARGKTGIRRRCPLWPETAEAICEALDNRPEPKDSKHRDLVFITPKGGPWRVSERRDRPNGEFHLTTHDFIGKQFTAHIKALGVHRPGIGYYSLRHTLRTVADATKDHPAIRQIMGHCDSSIDDIYRERIDDSRLRAVVDYVHDWLFGKEKFE